MKNHINDAVKILSKIFADGTYSNIALNENDVSDMTFKLVYGVLENNIKIDYILKQLIDKKPQNYVLNLLKVGVCALLIINNVPPYAIVSETVEVAKMNGKIGAGGFINAVMKKVSNTEYKLPTADDNNYLEINFSKPQWFINKLLSEYGKARTMEVLSEPSYELEHIRVNTKLTTIDKVKSKLDKSGVRYTESKCGGMNVRLDKTVKNLFRNGFLTVQSPSSMLAVQALNPQGKCKVLDLCSAPGGKAVFISEMCPDAKILACDIHPHRIELIEKYAKRMRACNISTTISDATKFKTEYENGFDYVLVDAPCSCLGTYKKHPDVFLTRQESDIEKLSKTQKEIIDNAVRYVKKGGTLVYSTCTLFKEENSEIRDYILSKGSFKLDKMNICFSNNGELQLLPHKEYDGFYIVKFVRE